MGRPRFLQFSTARNSNCGGGFSPFGPPLRLLRTLGIMPNFRDSITGAMPLDLNAKDGNQVVNIGVFDAQVPGGDVDNNRLLTCEVWNYGEDNIGPASAVVKAAPGVLGVAQVLTADSGKYVTFYDAAAALAGGEIVLGVLDLTTVGTQVYFRRPASVGIWAEFDSGATAGVVAVGYL